MKKVIALTVVALMAINVNAAPERKMLEEGKRWMYVYHHFKDSESQHGGDYKETTWLSYYYLKGDTVIDGLTSVITKRNITVLSARMKRDVCICIPNTTRRI